MPTTQPTPAGSPVITVAPLQQPSPPGIVEKTRDYLQARGQPTLPPNNSSTQRSVRGMTNLVDALLVKGFVTEQDYKAAKYESLTTNISPLLILQQKGKIGEEQIQRTKAEMYGLGFIDLPAVTINPELMNKIPKDVAARNLAVVFDMTANRYKVAMVDPLDLQRVQFLESMLGKRIDGYYAAQTAIQNVIDTKYGAQIGNVVDRALEDVGVVDIQDQAGQKLDRNAVEGAPVAKIVNMILDYAINHGASDVHIEPREDRIAVRFRIHGILSEKLTLPVKLANSVVARIKILANMRIDEHRVPQDNRFQVKTERRAVDIRVSVMPSIYGEKVVMRLLEKDKGVIPLSDLGLRGPALQKYQRGIHKTQGIVLITGPTGSGKTVTLASSLSVMNTQEVNIVTIEDPVEIRINGITQVQVNPDVGLTFSTGLRSFLRQDPDVIMVGEIRDAETAELAIQAALTGHLVLATLHTNSAAGALPRLLDIGIEPYLLSSTINCIVGQRLVRSISDECRTEYDADEAAMQILHHQLDPLNAFDLTVRHTNQKLRFDSQTKNVKLYKPADTPKCGAEEGYSGRIGIFEVMEVGESISKLIMQNASAEQIQRQAQSEGMISMVQDGFMKAIEGLTTIEEVLRVQNV